jgi:hypothetical protein
MLRVFVDSIVAFFVGVLLGPVVYSVDYWAFAKVPAWIKRNGRVLFVGSTLFAAGMIVGLVIDKPSDGLLTFIGSFAGISAAIGGGLWLWEAQDERSRKRTYFAAVDSMKMLSGPLKKLRVKALGIVEEEDQGRAAHAQINFSAAANSFLTANKHFKDRLARYDVHIIELDVALQRMHAEIERKLHFIARRARRARDLIKSPNRNVSATFFEIGAICVQVQERAEDLMQKIGEFEGGVAH